MIFLLRYPGKRKLFKNHNSIKKSKILFLSQKKSLRVYFIHIEINIIMKFDPSLLPLVKPQLTILLSYDFQIGNRNVCDKNINGV